MSVATYAAGVDRRDQRFGCCVTVEGLGNTAAGIFFLCDFAPDWAAGNAAWLEVLAHPRPSLMPERVSPLGGISEAGELEVSFVDVADFYTSQCGFERDADAFLTAAISAGATAVILDRAVDVGVRLYAASETMVVTADLGANRYRVTRAAIGTEAQRHEEGDAVRFLMPQVRSRRARLYVYPLDGADVSTMRLIGTYFVDQAELDDTFNVWTLRGKGQLKHLGRTVARAQLRGELIGWYPERDAALFGFFGRAHYLWQDPSALTDDDAFTLLVDDEVMGVSHIRTPSGATSVCGRPIRGLLGTKVEDHKVNAPVARIYAAGRDLRYSPGPSPSFDRLSGTWELARNWVDHLLIIALSSAHEEDGLELINYTSWTGNWSSLPPGIGVGLPVAQLDVEAALAVKHRSADCNFDHFYFGDEAVPFGELITEKLLKPVGAFIATSGGLATIKLPRAPFSTGASFTIGPAQILRKKVGKRRYLPRVEVSQDMSLLVGAVRCKGMRTADGTLVEKVFSEPDFAATYGQRGFYGADEGQTEVDASAVQAGGGGSVPFLERRSSSSVLRFRRPPQRLKMECDDSLYEIQIADIASVTLDEIPDYVRAARGVENMPVEILTVEPVLDDKADGGSFLILEGLGYLPGLRIGRVSASGRASADSTVSSGNSVVTLDANRFTSPDALNDLPTTDAASFHVNDVVTVLDATLIPTGSPRTVVAIGSNAITLSGTTTVPEGSVIVYADHPDQVAAQQEGYVSFGDRTSGVIAGSDQPYWHFGEP